MAAQPSVHGRGHCSMDKASGWLVGSCISIGDLKNERAMGYVLSRSHSCWLTAVIQQGSKGMRLPA